ncbi:hypothetical protein D3C83_166480 [compost metagenome]
MEDMMARAKFAGARGNPGIAAGGGAPAAGPASLAAAPPSGDAVFKAVQDLGLKLESRKVPVEILVIDRLEKNPTDN